MKKFLVLACAFALSACGVTSAAGPGPAPPISEAPPAPLAGTQIDDRGLILAWNAFDTALYAVDAMIAVKKIEPGSPKALAIADAASAVRNWLNAATEAQRLGQTASYGAAMAQAEAAMIAFRRALE